MRPRSQPLTAEARYARALRAPQAPNDTVVCPFRAQIMESSQTLLHVLKRESVNLTKKKQTSS